MATENDTAIGRSRVLVRSVLRIGIAAVLLGPAMSKFLTYERSVQFFSTLALPAPEVLVLVVGVVEIAVAGLLVLDRAPRVAAVTTVPVMTVAIVTAGPSWKNVGVLVAALLLLGIDTANRGIPVSESTP